MKPMDRNRASCDLSVHVVRTRGADNRLVFAERRPRHGYYRSCISKNL